MTLRRLWILTILLFLGHLIIQFSFYFKLNLNNTKGIISFLIFVTSHLSFILLFGAGIGALFSMIPFRQWKYRQKFMFSFPITTSILISIFISVYGYSIINSRLNGLESRSNETYDNILIPNNLECNSIHDGKFETDIALIERNGDIQIETDKSSGRKHKYSVKWINDCEYLLVPEEASLLTTKVKIVEINYEGYKCYCVPEKYKDNRAVLLTIRKKK